jgi:hypothetical protein
VNPKAAFAPGADAKFAAEQCDALPHPDQPAPARAVAGLLVGRALAIIRDFQFEAVWRMPDSDAGASRAGLNDRPRPGRKPVFSP